MTKETAHMPIRAYLQTAAADVSGLERFDMSAETDRERAWPVSDPHPEGDWVKFSDVQTLSASNAALEAENVRLREALADLIGHAKWAAAEFDIHYSHLTRCEAALSAPKGGQ
jgi:hypothetical protein